MCRIAGILNNQQNVSVTETFVKNMCGLMKHGGPDDEGIYSQANCGLVLGNRRLALLDLSPAGHMPMHYADRYVITYNGEIYNHGELRAELEELGHVFHNHTDTEVVLAAFSQWSVHGFSRFNGMFAFALWDKQEQELYLVRDQAGIKPLYYSLDGGALVFASEVRAFKSAGRPYASHASWAVMLMAYGHLPEPVTCYKEVLPLQKGCFLHYSPASGRSRLQSYNHYSFGNRVKSREEAMSLVAEKLAHAIEKQMLADAPVGIFLSGGLDSSIIASLAAKKSTDAIKTLSIYFNDEGFSEKKYQDLVIDKLHCSFHQELLKKEEFLKAFPEVLDAMDLPSCDGVNTWFISKYARQQGLKAVLSGIGGDELFGGYPSFERMHIASRLQQLPDAMIGMGKRSRMRRLSRMAYLQLDGLKGIYLFLRGHFTPHEIARHLDMDEKQVWAALEECPLFMDVHTLGAGNKASWMEFNMYMQNQLLRDADVMSMSQSVEIRVPFLDHELVQLANDIEAGIKYPGPLPKQLLINCFKDILPAEVYNRPKMGFSFPFDAWFKDSLYIKELLQGGNKASAESYDAFMKGDMRWYKMMTLVNLRKRGV